MTAALACRRRRLLNRARRARLVATELAWAIWGPPADDPETWMAYIRTKALEERLRKEAGRLG